MKESNLKTMSYVPFLGIAFIMLKLMGYIDWAWCVVLAPFWVPLAVVIVCLLILGGIEYHDLNK